MYSFFIGFYQHQNKLYSNTASMMFCSDWSYCDGWGKMRVRGRWAGTDSGNGKSNQAANKIKGLTLRDVINDISTLCEEIHQTWATFCDLWAWVAPLINLKTPHHMTIQQHSDFYTK